MVGSTEFWIIVGVVVLLFGASAIPKLARSIGKARSEFDKGIKAGKQEAIEEKKEESEKEVESS
jgi:sec-independent protein translocase protein TatA